MGPGLYWNFLSIYRHLITGLGKAFSSGLGQITSIGIDSFCNDFEIVDKQGTLLTPVCCCRDPRSERAQS